MKPVLLAKFTQKAHAAILMTLRLLGASISKT
jgi:hypothetical protein